MPLDLPPPDPGVEIVTATRGMSKGIAQTDGPQIIGKGFLRLSDVQFGIQWKNVSSSSSSGEGSAFLTASRKLGSMQVSGGIAYKIQTGVHGPSDSAAWEFTAGASRKSGPVTARLNAIFSPDDLGSALRSLFVEAGPAVQLGKGWTASAAIGRRSRVNGTNYTAFNAGLGRSAGPLQFDVRYYDTSRSDAEIYRRRVVASARISF